MQNPDIICKKIIDTLATKVQRRYTCPICQNTNAHMIIADGLIYNILQTFDLRGGNIRLGGRQIPACTLICSSCGFMTQHAIFPLFDGEENFLTIIKENA